MVTAEAINQIGKSARIVHDTFGGHGHYDAATNAFVGTIWDVDGNVFQGNSTGNVLATSSGNIFNVSSSNDLTNCNQNVFGQSSDANILVGSANNIFVMNCSSNTLTDSVNNTFETLCQNIILNTGWYNTFKSGVANFNSINVNFDYCIVAGGDYSIIDFTNAAQLFGRGVIWSIDKVLGTDLLEVTFDANLSTAQTGTYDTSTDTFTAYPSVSEIANSLSSGLIDGGLMTINANPALFDITAGTAVIIDSWTVPSAPVTYSVSWATQTGITVTNIGTSTVTYVYVDNTGALVQTTVSPTSITRRDYVFLGQLGHTNLTTIAAIINRPDVLASPIQQHRDLEAAIGVINNGNKITANGANLNINKSSGTLYLNGLNFHTDPKTPSFKTFASATALTFRYRTQTGNGASTALIDPTNYDNAGTITAIVGTKSTNQRIYLTAGGNVVIQYGQTVYNSQALAQAAINSESFVLFPNLEESAVLLCVLTVQSNCTDLTDSTRATFTYASKFGETQASGGSGGSGDVTKVGTPVNNQVGVWTGDGTIEGDTALTFDTTTDTLTTVNVTLSGALNESQGANIASAATTNIGAATGNYVNITGTTTITALGTVQAGTRRVVNFNGILTLTHNGTSLILPTAANITTAAGDTATFISLGSGNWVCVNYMRASGAALVSSNTQTLTCIGLVLATVADATNYHIGTIAGTPAGTDARRAFKPTSNCTVTAASLVLEQTTNGSNETVSIYLRNVTDATETLLGTFTSDFGASTTLKTLFTGLSISLVTTKDYTIRFTTPTWGTNPANWIPSVTLQMTL